MNKGDKLYAIERNCKNGFKGYVTVSKVGKKYFYLEEFKHERFDISTLKEDGQSCYFIEIFRTEQEYLDRQETERLFNELRILFNSRNSFSLEQLRQIKSICTQEAIA